MGGEIVHAGIGTCTRCFYSHDLKVAATQRQSHQLICRQERRYHGTWHVQFLSFFKQRGHLATGLDLLTAAHHQMALYVSQRSRLGAALKMTFFLRVACEGGLPP